MVIMADGEIFTLRSSSIADGSLDFCSEPKEECERINRTIFYVLSPRRMQRMEVIRLPLTHRVNYLVHMGQQRFVYSARVELRVKGLYQRRLLKLSGIP